MKEVVAWIKLNPLTVASIVVIVLSLAFIGYVRFWEAPGLEKEITARQTDLNKVRQFQNQTITVPPENADDPQKVLRGITINAETIKVLSGIYANLNQQSREVLDVAERINREGHQVLVNNLFPSTPDSLAFRARENYRSALPTLLADAQRARRFRESTASEAGNGSGLTLPFLNAGLPPNRDTIQLALDQKVDEAASSADLSAYGPEQRENLLEEQRVLLINQLIDRAEQINIYADPSLGDATNPNPDFPLQVAELGQTQGSPTADELWEGQLQLWILQDIVQAIALANDVANTGNYGTYAEGSRKGEPIPSSVLNAPIKRLLQLEVLPGYVGLHTVGGMGALGGDTSSAGLTRSTGGALYPPPAGGMTAEPRETALPDNFVFAPTGRSSNGIFDVRHARLVVYADYQLLPRFFNALSKVNLMTIIDGRYTDLDEYGPEGLGSLYLYGAGDIVRAEFIIETLWLREWTADLMPPKVKQYVGLAEPAFDPNAPAF